MLRNRNWTWTHAHKQTGTRISSSDLWFRLERGQPRSQDPLCYSLEVKREPWQRGWSIVRSVTADRKHVGSEDEISSNGAETKSISTPQVNFQVVSATSNISRNDGAELSSLTSSI